MFVSPETDNLRSPTRLPRAWALAAFAFAVRAVVALELGRTASSLQLLGRPDEAEAAVERALREDAGSALAWVQAGRIRAAEGNHAAAEAGFLIALAEMQPSQAEEIFGRMLTRSPDRAAPIYGVWLRSLQRAGALDLYQETLRKAQKRAPSREPEQIPK